MAFFDEKGFVLRLKVTQDKIGAKDRDLAVLDVVLTHALQQLSDAGSLDHLVFKGGSMIRKIMLGNAARFSGDLDFALAKEALPNVTSVIADIAMRLNGELGGVEFTCNPQSDVKQTKHGNTHIVVPKFKTRLGDMSEIKVEIDHRAEPILPPIPLPQASQPFFKSLGFDPVQIRCLQYEEVMGEKIRAAFQRVKVRDIYDLRALSKIPFDPDLVRKVAVLKLWEAPQSSPGPFTGAGFLSKIETNAIAGHYDRDRADLIRFLKAGEVLDVKAIAVEIRNSFSFLGRMSNLEREVAQDMGQSKRDAYDTLREEARALRDHISAKGHDL